MGFWIFMLFCDLLIPAVMIGFGKRWQKKPPKEINSIYGYRTAMSMKNRDTWIFAHQYCGKIWYICGWILLVLSVALMFLSVGKDEDTVGVLGLVICLIQIVPLCVSIIMTERGLRRYFDKKGRRLFSGTPEGGYDQKTEDDLVTENQFSEKEENVAEAFAYRSTCIKRKYGAVIVKNDVVVSTGYNGSPRGYDNCCDIGICPRMERNMHQGEGYDICRAIHAEQNALLNCSREQTIGADLYLTGINPSDNSIHRARPCPLCARLIIQAGIRNVIMRTGEDADAYVIVPAKKLMWHH